MKIDTLSLLSSSWLNQDSFLLEICLQVSILQGISPPNFKKKALKKLLNRKVLKLVYFDAKHFKGSSSTTLFVNVCSKTSFLRNQNPHIKIFFVSLKFNDWSLTSEFCKTSIFLTMEDLRKLWNLPAYGITYTANDPFASQNFVFSIVIFSLLINLMGDQWLPIKVRMLKQIVALWTTDISK